MINARSALLKTRRGNCRIHFSLAALNLSHFGAKHIALFSAGGDMSDGQPSTSEPAAQVAS